MDIIGLAGFNHHFNSMSDGPQSDELSKALSDILSPSFSFRIMSAIRALFPSLRFLVSILAFLCLPPPCHVLTGAQVVPQDRELAKSQKAMRDVGKDILKDSRSILLAENSGKIERNTWQRNDLLSLLLKANMATDLHPHQRMSDEDVLCRASCVKLVIKNINEASRAAYIPRRWARND